MKYFIINILLGFLLLQSCGKFDQIVDLEVPVHEPKLVLNSIILNDDSDVFIHVAKSAGILDEFDNVPPKNVTLKLYDNGDLMATNWQQDTLYGDNSGGSYADLVFSTSLSTAFGIAGHTYKIEASSTQLGTAIAEETMPEAPDLQNYRLLDKINIDSDGDTIRYLEVTVKDVLDVENFYYIECYAFRNGGYSKLYLETRDLSVDPGNDGSKDEIIFNDNLFDGTTKKIEVFYYTDDFNSAPIDSIKLSLSQLNKSLFEYRIFSKNRNDGNPFAEPTILKSTIENGYGVIGLANRIESTIIL